MALVTLRSRMFSLIALLITVIAWLIVEATLNIEASLLNQYSASYENIRVYYLITATLLALLGPFEPKIRYWLHQSRIAQVIVIMSAGAASFAVMSLLGGNQPARLFKFPTGLWITVAHIVALSVLVVAYVTPAPSAKTAKTLRTVTLAVLLALGLALVILHIASLGEFMSLDLPDEPWLASTATNFALNGDLSPAYIASVFGSPDPALSRYYFAMGLWLKLIGDTSLSALRAFPLLVGGITVVMAALIFARQKHLNMIQVAVGLVALISLSAFVRTSHNLRMDIGLALYGILTLWGLLSFYGNVEKQYRWPLLMGLSLYIGLESVPFAGLPLGIAVGVMLVIWFITQPDKSKNWRFVAVYTLASAIACLAYLAAHFLPDIEASITGYLNFASVKVDVSAPGQFRNPVPIFMNYHTRFNLVLSPVEFATIFVAVFQLWRGRLPADRWLAAAITLGATLMLAFTPTSYGYWALFTPFAAYAIARLATTGLATRIAAFVLIPALVSAPIHDLLMTTQTQPNHKRLVEAEAISDQFEDGSTILGEPLFWFTLHADHNYIGWTAMGRYRRVHGTNFAETLAIFNPDSIICWINANRVCERVEALGLYTPPEEVVVAGVTYLIFHQLDQPPEAG